jgi:protein-tyrosine phosphatase
LRHRNLRDLGGLPTRDPTLVVRSGRFFRSSSPSRFDADEQRALGSLELQNLVDLRTTAEVTESSASDVVPGVAVAHLPLFETARENWIAPTDQRPEAAAGRYFEMVEDSILALAAIVQHVAQPSTPPFLVCCAAGRDRTGIVVACLLDLLDVTDEAMATDYAMSDSFDPESGGAQAATMLELLRLLRARYGSVQLMLAPHGVTEGVVNALRQEFLIREG